MLLIDPSSGQRRSLVTPFAASPFVVDAAAHDSNRNILYVAVGRPPEQAYSLATLNISTGIWLRNVSTGLPGAIYNLAWDQVSQRVIGAYPHTGQVLAIDPTNGATSAVGKFPLGSYTITFIINQWQHTRSFKDG